MRRCGYGRGLAAPASRSSPGQRRPEKSSFRLQGGLQFRLGDRLDPGANLVHLAVEIGQSVRLDIHRLTHEFRGAAQVVVGAEGLIVHDRGLAHSGPHAKTFRSADASRHPIFVGP